MEETKIFPPVYQDHEKIDIHIDIHPYGHKYQMDLKGAGGRLRRKIDMFPEDLYELNEKLRASFRNLVDGDDTREELIKELAKEGYNAFLKIFDSKEARAGFRKLLSYSKNTTIEITTDDFFLPWELLYVESSEQPMSTENFLGAKHIISRLIDFDETPFIPPYITQPLPRVGLLTDNDLEFVRLREIPFFERLMLEEKITLLTLGVLNPDDHQTGMNIFEVFLTDPLEIAHFACHAIGDKNHEASNMRLSKNFEITLSDLKALVELRMSENPIVVLNACGTGNINSKHAAFFAKEFLKFGARGVIATDCEVPDLFAAEFSERFYSEFLDGTSIGEALFKTRRHFIEKSNEVTVLIYSMYAAPMIRIANRQLVHAQGEQDG